MKHIRLHHKINDHYEQLKKNIKNGLLFHS